MIKQTNNNRERKEFAGRFYHEMFTHLLTTFWAMDQTNLPSDLNGTLLPKLFWSTMRKKCSSDWEKLLKFEAEDWEFAKILRSLNQFIQTVKGQYNFW